MNPRVRKIIMCVCAAVFIIAMVLLFLNMSGVPLSNVHYIFRPEPQLPERDFGEQKLTADREAIVMTCGYDTLDDSLKDTYDTVDEFVNKSEPERFTADCSHDEFRSVMSAYRNDHPEVFWLGADGTEYHYWDYGDSIDVEYYFAFEGDELDEMKEELSDRVEKIMAEAPEEASDYELELYFNDYLTKNIEYDTEKSGPMIRNSYGAMLFGRVVCAGYSEAFQLLCNRAGIECAEIYGYITHTDGEGNQTEENTLHQWNCVKIEGDWYYVDVTWNDISQMGGIMAHAYFNVTYDDLMPTRTFNPLYEDDPDREDSLFNSIIPECDATEYNYYKKSCTEITDPNDDDEIIAAIIEAAKEKRTSIDFRISDKLDFRSARDEIADKYVVQWTDAANFYNKDDPSIERPKKLYSYDKTHCIVIDLDYK